MQLPKYVIVAQIFLFFIGAIIAFVWQIWIGKGIWSTYILFYILMGGPIFISRGLMPIGASKVWNVAAILFGLGSYFLYFFEHFFNIWWHVGYFLIAIVFGLIMDRKTEAWALKKKNDNQFNDNQLKEEENNS
jgi:hypothetical protein